MRTEARAWPITVPGVPTGRQWLLAPLAVAALVLLVACGGSEADTPAATSGGGDGTATHDGTMEDAEEAAFLADVPVDRELTVGMIDVAFEPKSISLKAGEVVEVEFVNSGVLEHDFVIEHMPGHALMIAAHHDDHDGNAAAASPNAVHVHLEAGEDGMMRLKVDEPGEYAFYCSVPGHREAGMVGVLRVE